MRTVSDGKFEDFSRIFAQNENKYWNCALYLNDSVAIAAFLSEKVYSNC